MDWVSDAALKLSMLVVGSSMLIVQQRYLDISLANSHDAGRNEDTGQTWLEKMPPINDVDHMLSGL